MKHLPKTFLQQLLRITLSLVFGIVLLGTTPQIVAAQAELGDEANPDLGLSEKQKEIFSRQIFYYDVDIAAVCAGEGGSALTGSDNIEKAYNFFIGKGLTREQSAGILGNLIEESGVNPSSLQPSTTGTAPIDGRGFGIAQWTFASRQQPLVALAKKQGKPVNDLGVQLDFMWGELNGSHKAALEGLKGVKINPRDSTGRDTVEAATVIFHQIYEVSSDGASQIQERVNSGFGVYNNKKYTANSNAAVGQAKSTGSTCGGVAVDGYAFPLAPQTKRNYTNLPCTGRNVQTYTDRYGNSAPVPACHHDGSPAFDLMYESVSNAPVYAIADGHIVNPDRNYVMSPGAAGTACASTEYQIDKTTDPVEHYYWYGHILLDPKIREGTKLKAGEVIGKVAPTSYGSYCYGGGPHLHIDRGCSKNPKGTTQAEAQPFMGGYVDCRDPKFLTDLKKVWDSLPASATSR